MGSWADEVENDMDRCNMMINMTYWDKVLQASLHSENDKYNYLGINITSQKRRQELIPWTLINYKSKNYIDEFDTDNKNPPPITRQNGQIVE